LSRKTTALPSEADIRLILVKGSANDPKQTFGQKWIWLVAGHYWSFRSLKSLPNRDAISLAEDAVCHSNREHGRKVSYMLEAN
jgi:hypothetical protein